MPSISSVSISIFRSVKKQKVDYIYPIHRMRGNVRLVYNSELLPLEQVQVVLFVHYTFVWEVCKGGRWEPQPICSYSLVSLPSCFRNQLISVVSLHCAVGVIQLVILESPLIPGTR